MTENFFLNNFITFRDKPSPRRPPAPRRIRFILVCSFGAWANVVFARALWQSGAAWYLAGFAGIVLGSVWNLSLSSLFTWRTLKTTARKRESDKPFATDLEVSR